MRLLPIFIKYGIVIQMNEFSEFPPIEAVRRRVVEEGETISDAAKQLLPDLAVKNTRAAQAVISQILRSILTDAEYREIADRNRTLGGRKGGYKFHPEGFVTPSRRISRKLTRWREPWSDQETEVLRKILADTTGRYRYSSGLHAGSLSYSLIAQVLNTGFAGQRASRTPNSVFRFAKRLSEDSDTMEENSSAA